MRKALLTKTASLLAALMILSIAAPVLAMASVWFTDVKYEATGPDRGTVSGSVYSTANLSVGDSVYIDMKSIDGNPLSVIVATYNADKSGEFYYYDFSVTNVTYNPIILDYDNGLAVTEAVYRTKWNGGDNGDGDNGGGTPSPGPGGSTPGGGDSDGQPSNGTIEVTSGDEVSASELAKAFAASDHVTIIVKEGTVKLPVSALQAAANEKAGRTITIVTDFGTYTLPLSVFNFAELAAELGVNASELKIVVSITKADEDTVQAITSRADELDVELVADAIDFQLYAEDQDGNTASIESFGDTYVSRSIPLHASVDTNQTTGVVYDPNTGDLRFVPSVFRIVDGQAVVEILRNSNSVYTAVKADKSFSDVPANRWYTEDIHLLANKLIVAGMTESEFGLGRNVTRAEFAALLVRSLGLSVGESTTAFSDVAADKWYAAEIATAADAGLVYGYAEDGTFRPDRHISRAEIAAMVVRAMAYAGVEVELTEAEQEALLGQFSDASQIRWGRDEVAAAVKAGIVYGMDNGEIWPGTTASREQATAMIARYLVHVGFINEY